MNPIYKRSDGSVYLLLAWEPGVYFNTFANEEGRFSQTINETYESKEMSGFLNKIETITVEFKINLETKEVLNSAVIKQFNKENQIIKAENAIIDSDSVLNLEDDTAYVIIEENTMDYDGKTKINRFIYDCENIGETDKYGMIESKYHNFYYCKESGRVNLNTVELVR